MVSFSGCDVTNFEIGLIFPIKLFFNMTKKLRQKFKYLVKKKEFFCEMKSSLHYIQKGLQLPKISECQT